MPIIKIPAEECGATDDRRLMPGSRVEYRRTLWKVVGMYYGDRSKYLILRPLGLALENLQCPGVPHAAGAPGGAR